METAQATQRVQPIMRLLALQLFMLNGKPQLRSTEIPTAVAQYQRLPMR